MITVASYNCQQSQSLALTFLTKTAVGCDAICTQESGTRMSLHSYIASTPNFACSEAYQNDPCAVVTTTSERVRKSESLPIRAGKNENRSALLLQLRNELIVVNVHLTSGNERRSRAELALIYAHLRKDYSNNKWLIIGDFNHDPSGDYPNMCVAGPHYQGRSPLDWAMGNVDMVARAYPDYQGSDHGPWCVQIE